MINRYLPLALIVFASCQKDDYGSGKKFILAGQTDNLTHLIFPGDTILNGEETDINQDGGYEFMFNRFIDQMNQADCDSFVSGCLPDPCDCIPYFEIDARIKYYFPFDVVRHPDDNKPYPLPLELNDTISNDERWDEADSGTIHYEHVSYLFGVDHEGLWPWNEYKYLGFRWQQSQDTLFGWVKVKFNGNLIITEIAYQE